MTGTQKAVTAALATLALFALGVGTGVVIAPTVRSPAPAKQTSRETVDARGAARASSPRTRGGPDAARVPAPPRAVREPRPRVTGTGLTAARVRQIVAEELVRFAHEGPGEPPLPEPADPEMNADPVRREAVKQALLGLRQVVVEYDMKYAMGSRSRLRRPDASQMDFFADERIWPANALGWVQPDPLLYEILDESGTGFDPTRENGAWVFTGQMNRAITTSTGAALVFADGIGPDGVIAVQGGGTLLCKGDLAGKLVMDSYTTVIVEGAMSGSIVSTSYVTIFVRGRLSGSVKTESYANLRVMGGVSGKLDLHAGNNLYFGGYTPRSVVEGFTYRAGANVTLEASDLAVGEHTVLKGRVNVVVLEPQ